MSTICARKLSFFKKQILKTHVYFSNSVKKTVTQWTKNEKKIVQYQMCRVRMIAQMSKINIFFALLRISLKTM